MQAGEPATLHATAHCAASRTHHRDATPGGIVAASQDRVNTVAGCNFILVAVLGG
jgi:hypothetical protein